jgi:uncharacterized protein YqeY
MLGVEEPMSLKKKIDEEMKRALKAGEKARVGCLRMVKSKLQEREVALRGEEGVDYSLTDEEALKAIAGYAKQRRDSIESYEKGGRDDLVERERAELAIVEEFLPQQLGEEEVRDLLRQAIEETGASSPREMGAVMKAVMPKTQGRADGKLVSKLAREMLAGAD